MRRHRRTGRSRGFALAEALVALAVAAMTLAMLTGASWGLRTVSDRTEPRLDGPAALMTARRVVQAWATAIEPSTSRDPGARVIGNASELRMSLTDADGVPMVGALRILEDGNDHVLAAVRQIGLTDTRQLGDAARQTIMYRDTRVLRLSYLMPGEQGRGQVWTYEIDPEEGTPYAVAIEAGTDRLIVAPVQTTLAPDCIVALGSSGLEERRCKAR